MSDYQKYVTHDRTTLIIHSCVSRIRELSVVRSFVTYFWQSDITVSYTINNSVQVLVILMIELQNVL